MMADLAERDCTELFPLCSVASSLPYKEGGQDESRCTGLWLVFSSFSDAQDTHSQASALYADKVLGQHIFYVVVSICLTSGLC